MQSQINLQLVCLFVCLPELLFKCSRSRGFLNFSCSTLQVSSSFFKHGNSHRAWSRFPKPRIERFSFFNRSLRPPTAWPFGALVSSRPLVVCQTVRRGQLKLQNLWFQESQVLNARVDEGYFHLLKNMLFISPCWFERDSISPLEICFIFSRGLKQMQG